MAAAAAEEAQGKGSVDGVMEVQEVTESSGPLQPKSLNGLPSAYNSDFRHRNVSKGKQSKLEQGGSDVSMYSSTDGYLALEQAPENAGVDSEQGRPERNRLKAIRDGVGAVRPANSPRQKLGYTKLGSQKEPMKDVMEDESVLNKEDEKAPMLQPTVPQSIQDRSAVVTVGTMYTETSTNTRSNPSQGNAASSRRSKTAEWALLVASVVLEATSAIFEQLGYPLTSMVMAFVALLLSILDLILKARQRGITCDWCFYRQSNRNSRKPVASLVHYLGLAGALWQCSFTTVGYHYTHQKLVNPIKLCLLPFILALCVLISKVVKSSQHARLDSNAD
ncbi:hypothetical protein OIU76_027502 [Salix suchowensis]|nr:hypothetical protein OIU76_027502 [Salix suchowensis]